MRILLVLDRVENPASANAAKPAAPEKKSAAKPSAAKKQKALKIEAKEEHGWFCCRCISCNSSYFLKEL